MFTTIDDLASTPLPDYRCRFVKVNGARCRNHAKPNSDLCVDHHFKKSYSRGRYKPNPPASFNTVPLVRFAWAEDHDSILFNCNQIALALVHSAINAREAGALNALMHSAQRSLRQKFVHERFEARERERAALSPSPSSPSPDPHTDYVTDYVLDVDGMPLALPDPPVTSESVTDSPSSSQAVPEVSVGDAPNPAQPLPDSPPETPQPVSEPLPQDSCSLADNPEPHPAGSPDAEKDPGKQKESNYEKERDPAWIARQRESILYLREYFKKDPKMLAEIETYPAAAYAPIRKHEPFPQPEPATLATLQATADEKTPTAEAAPSHPPSPTRDPRSAALSAAPRAIRYPLSAAPHAIRCPYPPSPLSLTSNPNVCHTYTQRPPRSALFLTHSNFQKQNF